MPATHPMHPDDNHPLVIIIAAIVAAASALGSAILPAFSEMSAQAQEVMSEINRNVNIMDDARLRLVCLFASIGGALLSILLYPLPPVKPLIAKLFASSIAGVMFTPMLLRWLAVPVDTDTLLFFAGLCSMLSYSLLQAILPLLQKAGEKWVGVKLGTTPEDAAATKRQGKVPLFNPSDDGS